MDFEFAITELDNRLSHLEDVIRTVTGVRPVVKERTGLMGIMPEPMRAEVKLGVPCCGPKRKALEAMYEAYGPEPEEEVVVQLRRYWNHRRLS